MTTKNEALELAQHLESLQLFATPVTARIAAMLRSQVAEIEKLSTELSLLGSCCDKLRINARIERLELSDERDQLKAKNEKLASAVSNAIDALENSNSVIGTPSKGFAKVARQGNELALEICKEAPKEQT